MTKNLSLEHIRIANALLRVARRLRDLADVAVVLEAHPELPGLLLDLSQELRRSFRPRRWIQPRDRKAA